MARITDLASLRDQALDHLNRSDLVAVVDTLVQIAEDRLRADYRIWMWYPELPALTEEAPTNDLLAEMPSVYLYSTLVESAPYLKDDPRLVVWGTMLDTALTALHNKKWTADFEAGPMIPVRSNSFGD